MSAMTEMGPRELRLWEARTRRRLAAAGMRLAKSCARRQDSAGFGQYAILDGAGDSILPCPYILSRAEIDDWIADRLTTGGASSDAEPHTPGPASVDAGETTGWEDDAMSAEEISRAAEGIADTLTSIDSRKLDATPSQRAFLAGALCALRAVLGQAELRF